MIKLKLGIYMGNTDDTGVYLLKKLCKSEISMFSFGLLADIQYANKPPDIGRYYDRSLLKAAHCISAFNEKKVDFVVHLGDMVDWAGDCINGTAALQNMAAAFNKCEPRCYYVLGNHDVDSIPRETLARLWQIPALGYYSFDYQDTHFVVLDTNYDIHGNPYTPDYHKWDCTYVNQYQIQWLKEDLSKTEKPVIIFSHALLDELEDNHAVRNAEQIRRILENYKNTVTVFQGHLHGGYFSRTNNISYYTLKAIVQGENDFYFWIVTINDAAVTISEISDTLQNYV
jgi:alkaline phosphatase